MPAKKNTEKAREHALLSASSAHKWINCPPSARLEAGLPDQAGEAAKEGTLAHAMCELKLSRLFTDKNMSTRTYNGRMKKLQEQELYSPEMDRFTDEYVDYIKEIAFGFQTSPTIMIEKKLDYSAYAPEGFGTGDCVMLHGRELHIIDFKYGKGVPVSAEDNPQLGLYALGAIAEYGFIYPIETVSLHIVQPRINNISRQEILLANLLEWGEFVKERAALAFQGAGEFCDGPWCDSCFCKIAGTCRHRAEHNMELMKYAADPITGRPKEPATLTDEEVGQILKRAQYLSAWVKKLEKHALDTLVGGGEIPGWKLVEGRSNRTFTDTDSAMQAAIQAGYDEALLYEKKPIPLTEMEKLIDKDTWKNTIAGYIVKPQGKPTLAPADDKRAEYRAQPTAADAFGGENQYKEEQ